MNNNNIEGFSSALDLYKGRDPHFNEISINRFTNEQVIDLALDTLLKNKQALIFVSTRNSAEALAEKIALVIKKNKEFHKVIDLKQLNELSTTILNVLSSPTKQCKRLANSISMGIAFHHSGLVHKQRKLIEDSFRNGLIKIIVSTPTLAYGLNLPAFRVIIRDLKRFNPNWGNVWIPTLEYLQFIGRAGRPHLEDYGEAIIVLNNSSDFQRVLDQYIFGIPETISSKLASLPIFRTYLLALIASNYASTLDELRSIFLSTFYAYTFMDSNKIEQNIESALKTLIEKELITITNNRFTPTLVGKRISELYLDPLTGISFLEAINRKHKLLTDFSILSLVMNTLEAKPLLSVRQKEMDSISEELIHHESEFLFIPPNIYDVDYENFLSSFKTSLMLLDWINEYSEEYILEKYSAKPGDLFSKIEIADWLIYALSELARIKGNREIQAKCQEVRLRLKYGVKKELLFLTQFKGIGRVYARRIYNKGYRSLALLKKASFNELYSIIKKKNIALSLAQQLGIPIPEENSKNFKEKNLHAFS